MPSRSNILMKDNSFMGINDEDKKPFRDRVIDSYKREFLIRDQYLPILEKNYPQNEMKFLRHIAKYRDRWTDILSSIYPTNYPVFGDEDWKIIFTCTGINPKELDKTLSQVTLPKGVDRKANFTPTYTTLVMILHWYLTKSKNMERFNLVCRYLAYSMYWSILTRSFKVSMPNPGIMEYTINRINNKYIIKQLGSVDSLLLYCTLGSVKNNADLLEELFDYAICYIIDGVKGAIGGKVKGIASEYYHDWDNRETIFHGDEEKNYDARSVSYDTESYANQYTSKFFSEDPRRDLIKSAAILCEVSEEELYLTVRTLISANRIDEVKEFYSCLFHSYFAEPDADSNLRDKKLWINRMMVIYKRTHSKDKKDNTVRNLMNKWLTECSATFVRTDREATQNNYRKAVYIYFILLVATKDS